MNDIENVMVIERAWPVVKPMSAGELIDEYEREALFRSYDWLDDLDDQDKSEIISAAVQACFRDDPSFISASDRLAYIKAELLGIIETLAEKKAGEEE
ncbi:hypothetical protein M0Q28_07080 [Patescibacteria group bacterium]|jgi:hypothetical protein|nr:hypothetical protein [Patescibacteria group bacterium]